MMGIMKRHKKKLLASIPVAAALYCGFRTWKEAQKMALVQAPHIRQNPELPRGCEVTSLAMLLRHAGVAADKMELAHRLDCVPFEENGLNGSMREGFVGDMYSFSRPGLGVYIEPILRLASLYVPEGLVNLSGGEPEDMYRMLDHGAPVWLITNDTFAPLPEERFETWYTNNGPMQVTYAEHSVLLTGCSASHVLVNDPLYDVPNRRLPRKPFEAAWIQMGRQAFAYVRPETKQHGSAHAALHTK
ncbi:C39 family peptidase [Ectobacillus ponti]|uniref:C39 family peptidase n=1 Tax=Ectobacillus ponti TaxID=2961894 RepID=A0AA42BPD3_9BACI|nr:C39 family peptidase [Ectobacillus ponti]MCP8968637.1 C39 family peptidase [Ectobacillus ponti]